MLIKKILQDQRGSAFLENALWIILFVLTIAAFTSSLAGQVGVKFDELKTRIGEIGNP